MQASYGDLNSGFQAGIINGPVTYTSSTPLQEQPKTPPSPSILIPFDRDSHFVERGSILDDLHQRCATPGTRAAIVGLGGVGKSQIAIEYAYRVRERAQNTWVFWVHASNATRFDASFRQLADHVELPGRHHPRANIYKLIHDWLLNNKAPWLMILDNVDDGRFLLEPCINLNQPPDSAEATTRPLREYLPRGGLGSVIVTSRNRDVALELVKRNNIISIDPMAAEQAITLLQRKLGVHVDSAIENLAEALEYMPLAIVQASAYILQRTPIWSARRYLEKFKESERERTKLLSRDDKMHEQFNRDYEAKNAILLTWQISFEYVQETRQTAVNLLSLMSLFDRQKISRDLLRTRLDHGTGQSNTDCHGQDINNSSVKDAYIEGTADDARAESMKSDDDFTDDIIFLHNLCLISIDNDGASYWMHALVQLATRMWLNRSDKLEKWKDHFIDILRKAFPKIKYETWSKCRELLPHVKAALMHRPRMPSSLLKWADLLCSAASYAEAVGQFADAKELALNSLNTRKTILGHFDDDTLRSATVLASVCKLGGLDDAAEILELHVMKIRTRKLGRVHKDTLEIMAALAETYRRQRRLGRAEALLLEIISICKETLGVDDHRTLAQMHNLAAVYQSQKCLESAWKLNWDIFYAIQNKFGDEHPYTITTIQNLASLSQLEGHTRMAVKLYLRVNEANKKILGEYHENTLLGMYNLGMIYMTQQKWDEAEKLLFPVGERRKTLLGKRHPLTKNTMLAISIIWENQGKDVESLRLRTEYKLNV